MTLSSQKQENPIVAYDGAGGKENTSPTLPTLSFPEGVRMAARVLTKGPSGLVEAMGDKPEGNLFFRWPEILNQLLRMSEGVLVVADPKDIKSILVGQHDNIEKATRDFRIIREFLGNALVPSIGGESWYERRKVLMPTFSHSRVKEFGDTIAQETNAFLQTATDSPEMVSLNQEMIHLTLRVITQFLFSEQITQEQQEAISDHITALAEYTSRRIQNLGWPPRWFPGKTNNNFKEALAGMHDILGGFYDTRSSMAGPMPDDMMTVLMQSQDGETGQPLTKTQVLDECLSMLIAGHETTANALTWTFYLLSKHPQEQEKIRDQIAAAVGDREITTDDLKNLPLVNWALKESMRLYPPVWVFSRKNLQEFTLNNGQTVPEKTFIAFVPWLIHRNPTYWKNPDEFNPARFDPHNPDDGVKDAFLPFGMGQRRCIGADLAFTEASIVLAKALQKTQVDVPARIEPSLLITTRPDSQVMATFKKVDPQVRETAENTTTIQEMPLSPGRQ